MKRIWCEAVKLANEYTVEINNIQVNHNVTIQWIPGVVGVLGNEIASKLAGKQ